MSDSANRQVVVKIKSYATGEPTIDHFAVVEQPVPEPQAGQFLARTIYLSLDPYMRGRMSGVETYAKPAELNRPMVGATVGQVVRSLHPEYAEGDLVLGYWGWQQYGISDGSGVRKL